MRFRLRPFVRKLRNQAFLWRRAIAAAALATALLTAVFAASAAVWPAVMGHSYFKLRSVKIACDSACADPQFLAARAGLYEGLSLWAVNAGKVRHALESLDWVREVEVARRLPSQVSLVIRSRRPLAATVVGGVPYLIDAEGVVYRRKGGDWPDLPYLSGWQSPRSRGQRLLRLRALLAVAQTTAERGLAVSQVAIDEKGLVIYCRDRPLAVRVSSPAQLDAYLGRLKTVLGRLDVRTETHPLEVDLTYSGRAVVRAPAGRYAALLRTARPEPRRLKRGGGESG